MGAHMHIYPNNQTNKWRVYGLYFLFGLCSLYIMQAAVGWILHVCVSGNFFHLCELLFLLMHTSVFHIRSCIHLYENAATCLSVCVSICAQHRPVCLSQHILHSLSCAPPPFPPPGTYMHVCRLCTAPAAVARANLTAMQPCVH